MPVQERTYVDVLLAPLTDAQAAVVRKDFLPPREHLRKGLLELIEPQDFDRLCQNYKAAALVTDVCFLGESHKSPQPPEVDMLRSSQEMTLRERLTGVDLLSTVYWVDYENGTGPPFLVSDSVMNLFPAVDELVLEFITRPAKFLNSQYAE